MWFPIFVDLSMLAKSYLKCSTQFKASEMRLYWVLHGGSGNQKTGISKEFGLAFHGQPKLGHAIFARAKCGNVGLVICVRYRIAGQITLDPRSFLRDSLVWPKFALPLSRSEQLYQAVELLNKHLPQDWCLVHCSRKPMSYCVADGTIAGTYLVLRGHYQALMYRQQTYLHLRGAAVFSQTIGITKLCQNSKASKLISTVMLIGVKLKQNLF